jgi:transcription termination/antitermination protein NusG
LSSHQFMTQTDATAWFALRVKSNREWVTAHGLAGMGYDVFLPQIAQNAAASSKRSNRVLFPGYLFCRFDVNNRLPILMLPGIVHVVGSGKTPIPVDEGELESLKILVKAGLRLEREIDVAVGQPIRIEQGPLRGARGIVVGARNQRLVVSISLLQRAVSVELPLEWISAESAALSTAAYF